MKDLIDGVVKFQKEIYPEKKELFARLAGKQTPRALFITCADSRVVPDLLTQCEPGDLFICRNAGNIVPTYGGSAMGGVSATIEYAVVALKIEHIVVLGHSDCGAMKGILHPEHVKHMPAVAAWLHHGDIARLMVEENYPNLDEEGKLRATIEENVVAQVVSVRILRWRRGWLAKRSAFTVGSTTSKMALSGPSMPIRGASCRSTVVAVRARSGASAARWKRTEASPAGCSYSKTSCWRSQAISASSP
jgi:carbonic anhydrase